MKTAADRFDDLVSLYLDEALDPEGIEELSRLLAARADLAGRFVRLSAVHGSLREVEDPEAAARMLEPLPPRLSGAATVWIGIALAAAALAIVLWKLFGGGGA